MPPTAGAMRAVRSAVATALGLMLVLALLGPASARHPTINATRPLPPTQRATSLVVHTRSAGLATHADYLTALSEYLASHNASITHTSAHGTVTISVPRGGTHFADGAPSLHTMRQVTQTLAAFPGVRSVRPQLGPRMRTAVVASDASVATGASDGRDAASALPAVMRATTGQGDAGVDAPYLRAHFGTGLGISIGVISDSASSASIAALQTSGDLPPGVHVLRAGRGTDEGTAILAIVHAVAPDADLYFYTCGNSQTDMADAIDALTAAGCRVVVDDVGWSDESPLHSSSAVSDAVGRADAAGVLYVSSAGNDGATAVHTSGTWEGPFVPASVSNLTLSYGSTSVSVLRLLGPATPVAISLWWADPLGGSCNDYDLYLYDEHGTEIGVSDYGQTCWQDPFEIIYNLPALNYNAHSYYVRVVKYVPPSGAAPADRFISVHLFGCDGYCTLNQTTAGAVYGHPAHPAALAVGAFDVGGCAGGGCYEAEIDAETFSSDGPRVVFYGTDGVTPLVETLNGPGVVLQKPDFAGPDGVASPLDYFNPFYGTSASAPQIAALAALVLSVNPAQRPSAAHLRQLLNYTTYALPPTAQTGSGLPWVRDVLALYCASGQYLDSANYSCASCSGGGTGTFGAESCVKAGAGSGNGNGGGGGGGGGRATSGALRGATTPSVAALVLQGGLLVATLLYTVL